MSKGEIKQLIEEFANIEHMRWAKWQAYLHSKCEELIHIGNRSLVIPATLVERWERQIVTPYAELSEQEKASDRGEVEYYIKRFQELLRLQEEDLIDKVSKFLKEELSYKGEYIEPIPMKHGACCCCRDCGQFHDDCVCESNRAHIFINQLRKHHE